MNSKGVNKCLLTWSAQHNVEVHAVDTDAWVVLDAQVDVLLNAEAKVACVGEVVLAQLVLTHLDIMKTVDR